MKNNNKGNNMKLIGITGKAGAGKDTIASILWRAHSFTVMPFAGPLKAAAAHMFGLGMQHFNDREMKEKVNTYWGMSPRQMLQLLGTEAVKPHFGEDIWIKRWNLDYGALAETDHIVVPDVRFDPEANHLRKLNGIIIEVRRPAAGLAGDTGSHASERGLTMEPDFVIMNDGSLEDLIIKVQNLMRELD